MELQPKVDRFIRLIFEMMDVHADLEFNDDEEALFIGIHTDEPGLLIGRRGETLDALQYLVNIAMNKGEEERRRIVLDVEGYREERKKTLEDLARSAAEAVVGEGMPRVLEPMNPFERRIVHMALLDYPGVETASDGEEPYRKVTIFPKKDG